MKLKLVLPVIILAIELIRLYRQEKKKREKDITPQDKKGVDDDDDNHNFDFFND